MNILVKQYLPALLDISAFKSCAAFRIQFCFWGGNVFSCNMLVQFDID